MRLATLFSAVLAWTLVLAGRLAQADPMAETIAYAQGLFGESQARYRREPTNPQAACEFGRACFELAECATNRAQRAELADQGIAACRQAIARASNSGPAHYYLAVNLGQLARTRGLGALKLVNSMRREFDLARSLDERVDHAGPDRGLGEICRDAPPIISLGDRAQAEQHLRHAVTLAPDFPDNHLELIEGYLKWGQPDKARRQLEALESSWPAARARLTGPAWAASWADWENERKTFSQKCQALSPSPIP
jgi:tetratricopeptide (TPR) repeat protein